MTETQLQMLKEIVADPGNDTLRLAYADLCTECGDELHAALIRSYLLPPVSGSKGKRKSLSRQYRRRLRHRYGLGNGECFSHVDRGLAVEVRLLWSSFLRVAEQLIVENPLRRIVVTRFDAMAWHPGERSRTINNRLSTTVEEWQKAHSGIRLACPNLNYLYPLSDNIYIPNFEPDANLLVNIVRSSRTFPINHATRLTPVPQPARECSLEFTATANAKETPLSEALQNWIEKVGGDQ